MLFETMFCFEDPSNMSVKKISSTVCQNHFDASNYWKHQYN